MPNPIPSQSRRRLLAGFASGAVTVALAACGAGGSAGGTVSSAPTGSRSTASGSASGGVTTASASRSSSAAATGNATPQPTRIPVKAGQTGIEYWHWGSEEYNQRNRRIADAFTQANPSIVVQTVNPGDLTQKLLTAFAGGAPPDAFALDIQLVQQFGDTGQVLDLSSRIHQDKAAWLDTYLNDSLSKPMFDQIYTYKGSQILALPSEASPNLFFYNADLFRQKGLQTPYELYKADQWTWENFLDGARKITVQKPDGSYDIAGAGMGESRLWIDASGGQEFDDIHHPKQARYDQDADVQAISFLQKAINQDKVIPQSFSKQVGQSEDDAFIAGRLALKARWTTGIGIYKKITQFKWGMVPYPKRTNYVNDYATGGPTMVAITKGKSTNDAAWKWATFKCGPDGLMIFAEWGTGVPFAQQAQDKTLEVHKGIPSLETPGFDIELLKTGKYDFFRMLDKDQSKLEGIVGKHLAEVWANKTDARTACTQITQECNAFLQQNPQ